MTKVCRLCLILYKNYTTIPIIAICKCLDDVSDSDFPSDSNTEKLHLFSNINILDIDDYNPRNLQKQISRNLTPNKRNYFICVSPYIDDIKTSRICSFVNAFKVNPSYKQYISLMNPKNDEYWLCNNGFQKKVINHSQYLNCNATDSIGYYNEWTRVIKVFSV